MIIKTYTFHYVAADLASIFGLEDVQIVGMINKKKGSECRN